MSIRSPILPLAALALVAPVLAQAQNYDDLPPLTPMGEAELRTLPPEYRTAPVTAPVMSETTETVTTADGVETITRTRRIEASAPAHTYGYPGTYPSGYAPQQGYPAGYPQAAYAPAYAPAVFERQQWIDECNRRIAGQDKDDTGAIIGGLLGAIAGGFIGHEIAAVGDEVLGAAFGVAGGGLLGGLIGSLFDGDDDEDRYDCEAALDAYLSQYSAPDARIASRTIAYPAYAPAPAYGYGYPASYGYSYAPPPQMVLVPVRSEVQQQVVVREKERYETYTVPGAARTIPPPSPRPSPKMIKSDR